MILSTALEEFKQWGMTVYAPCTVRTYTDLIKRFIGYAGDIHAQDVTIAHLTGYYAHLKAKKYHDSSIAYMLIALRQFMKYLFLRRVIFWDYRLVRIPKYVSTPYTPIETEEAKAMADKILADRLLTLRDKVIILFLYSSGVRVSELCDLRIGQIIRGERRAVIISKKNRKKRMIFWNDETNEYLIEYLEKRKEVAKTDHVFISMAQQNRGEGMTTRSVQRIVERVRERRCISPHSFRHGFGMREVQARIHPRYIQAHLGHLHLNSSQVYMDICDPDVQKAYDEVGH